MKNINESNSSECIKIELQKAGIDSTVSQNDYKIQAVVANVHNWNFKRNYRYWIVESEGNGLPLSIAKQLHSKKYPDEMFDDYQMIRKYGNVIRVIGHAGCPEPDGWDTNGYINSYHIDTQEGLNEFVRTIKLYHAKTDQPKRKRTFSDEQFDGISNGFVTFLLNKLDKCEDEQKIIIKEIEQIQDNCDHTYKFLCDGAYDDAYKCSICGHLIFK